MDVDLNLYAESLAGVLAEKSWGLMVAVWSVLGVMERKMNEVDITSDVRGSYMILD